MYVCICVCMCVCACLTKDLGSELVSRPANGMLIEIHIQIRLDDFHFFLKQYLFARSLPQSLVLSRLLAKLFAFAV